MDAEAAMAGLKGVWFCPQKEHSGCI